MIYQMILWLNIFQEKLKAQQEKEELQVRYPKSPWYLEFPMHDDTMGFSEFSSKMKLHLNNLCLQARIDFYNQQKEEQKANRAKYREKVRRQKNKRNV